jgi:hypothetical protein
LLDNTNTTNNSNSPDSNSTSSEFNFLDEQQQAILDQLEVSAQPQSATNSVQPLSFVLSETVENGMKIKNEIILNFDQMDEAQLYEQYELLSKIDLGQQLNVITMSSSDTCIDLSNEESKMSDNDDEEDDDSEEENDSEERSANASKTKNKKVEFHFLLIFMRLNLG